MQRNRNINRDNDTTDTHHNRGNLAARAGRWSAQHRKSAIIGWFLFVALAVFAGNQVGQKNIADIDHYSGESRVAEELVQDNFPADPTTESVVVTSKQYSYGDRNFNAALTSVTDELTRQKSVADIRSPLTRDGPVSEDGHVALVQFTIKGDEEEAAEKVEPIAAAVEKAGTAHQGIAIGQFGDASFEHQLTKVFEDDFAKARSISLPITLLILVFAFGALVAAGLPVLLAITAVMATLGLIAIPSQIMPVDDAIAEVVLLIGMAVGIDYSLFYLKREREERAAGRGARAALEAAAATSGRAVLISGLTVIVAMSGMFIADSPTFSSFAVGTIMVVAIAMVGSLSVLPAMLSALGDKVDRGRIPFIAKRRQRAVAEGKEGGVWSKIVAVVLKRPAIAAFAAAALLIALALPALHLETQQEGVETLPQDIPAMVAYKQAQVLFPEENVPATVVLKTDDVESAEARRAIGEFVTRIGETPGFVAPRPDDITTNPADTVVRIDVPMINADDDSRAERDIETLRGSVVPETLGTIPGATVATTGMTASSVDFNQLMRDRLPLVFAFVLGLAFLLLLITFRSLVIPVMSIVLNLLSVAAAYGVMVLVFQHGWASSLLGFEGTFGIVPWLPLFMFVVLFGLSMDYHVFILSRIRELRDHGMTTEDAVTRGISATAGVVTSAAAVMVAVFAVFGSLSMISIKQMGVGLAVAVLLDATIVRAVLLPATMKLLGEANWYLPRWLEWLPKVQAEASAPVRPAPAIKNDPQPTPAEA